MNPLEITHSTPSEDQQEPSQAAESDGLELKEEDLTQAETEASTEASEEVTVTD